MLSALYAIALRPSVTRVDHAETVEDRIMKFSPYCSTIPLVYAGQVSSRNSNGFYPSGTSKKGGVGINYFLDLSDNISKTAAVIIRPVTINDYMEVAYALSIDTKIDDLG